MSAMGRTRRKLGPGCGPTRAALLAVVLLGGCTASRQPSASAATGLGGLASASAATTGPSGPSVAPAGTPTATSTATALPTPSPLPARTGDWTSVPDQASVRGVQFQDVVWTGSRFVATAVVLGGGGSVLDSTDGRHWHLQPSIANAQPTRLAAGPRGVVAIGRIGEDLASWASVDGGLTWIGRADAFPVPSAGDDTFEVGDLVASDGGWLAVGHQDRSCNVNCGMTPRRALTWTSGDGLHWTRGATADSFSNAGMNAITRLGPGFVAGGSARGHAAFWTSPTGATWSSVANTPSAWAPTIGLASDTNLVVAVGMDRVADSGAPSVRAWWSADGRTWAQASVERSLEGQVFDVAATPAGFLATGPSGGSACAGGIWASTDGQAWTCDAAGGGFDGFGTYAAAGSDTIEVAVGLRSGETSDDGLPGAAWSRPLH